MAQEPPTTQTVPPSSPREISSRYDSAIIVRRWMASWIDMAVIIAIFLAAHQVLGQVWYEKLLLLWVGFAALYFPLLEGTKGWTFGKLAARIRVVDTSGQIPGIGRAIIRTLPRLFEVNPFLLGGLPAGLVALYSKAHQRVGDMWADTYVLKVSDVVVLGTAQGGDQSNRQMLTMADLVAMIPAVLTVGVIALPTLAVLTNLFTFPGANVVAGVLGPALMISVGYSGSRDGRVAVGALAGGLAGSIHAIVSTVALVLFEPTLPLPDTGRFDLLPIFFHRDCFPWGGIRFDRSHLQAQDHRATPYSGLTGRWNCGPVGPCIMDIVDIGRPGRSFRHCGRLGPQFNGKTLGGARDSGNA